MYTKYCGRRLAVVYISCEQVSSYNVQYNIIVTLPASFLGCTIYRVNCHISQLLVSAGNNQRPFLRSKNSKDIYKLIVKIG